MSVRDFINKRKQEFFTAKTPEGLRSQRDSLMKEKNILQERENLRQEVVREQQAIHSLRSAPAREKLNAVQAFGSRFKGASQKANTFFHGDTPPGLIQAHDRRQRGTPGLPQSSPQSQGGFPQPTGLFAQGDPAVPKTNAPKATNGRTVVIHLRK